MKGQTTEREVVKVPAGSFHHHLLPYRRLLEFEVGDGLFGLGEQSLGLGQLPFVLLGHGRRDLDLLRAGFLAFAALAFVLVVMVVFFVPVVFLVAICLSLFIWGSYFDVATIAMPVTDSYLGSTNSSRGLRAEFRMWPKILESNQKSQSFGRREVLNGFTSEFAVSVQLKI